MCMNIQCLPAEQLLAGLIHQFSKWHNMICTDFRYLLALNLMFPKAETDEINFQIPPFLVQHVPNFPLNLIKCITINHLSTPKFMRLIKPQFIKGHYLLTNFATN